MDETAPLIIELRCNETAYKADRRPNLPYSSQEIVRDAVEGQEAGASILHWHARDPETGEPKNDVELYAEVYRGVRENTDLLLHPTLGGYQTDAQERVRHVLAVNDDPELRVDMAPVAFGSVDVDLWDPQEKDFATKDLVFYNPRERLEYTLATLKEHGVHAVPVIWNVGHARTARCFREMGLLPEPTIWQLLFTGDTLPGGTLPTMYALRSMVEQVPPGEPWSVACHNGDAMALAAWAIPLGGHVSIGLGDHHYDRFGAPTNAELVRRVAEMGETLGRPVATPAQAREILGMGRDRGVAP